ncbi:MAG TPA: ABC transporter permease, partial [Pyrinomonadaceae bacterium]
MNSILKDFVYGLRSLLKHPGFTAIAVVILALGVAATTAIFSVVNGVLLRPLPYPEPDRLMVITEVNPQQGPEPFELSYLNWLDLRQQSKSFEEIAGVEFSSSVLTINGEPSRIMTTAVSANLFPLLRAHAAQGRTFLPEDEKAGANRVVVVSQRFWQRYFPNQSLNNQGINLDNNGYAVVGVMPAGFQFPDDKMDVWAPFGPNSAARYYQNRAVHFIFGLGRIKPGIAPEDAQKELAGIFAGIQQEHAKEDAGHSVTITSLQER